MGAFAQSKYCLEGYAICSTSAGIRYDDFSAADRRDSNVVEDAGNAIDLVRTGTGKCEDRKKVAISPLLVANVSTIGFMTETSMRAS